MNVIENVMLECTDYNARILLERERKGRMWREHTPLQRKRYRLALNVAREICWVDGEKPDKLMSNEEVVQLVLEQALALVDRLHKGEV